MRAPRGPAITILLAALFLAACNDPPAVVTPDAGPATECRAGEAPRACGKSDACRQACSADGTWGACEPATGPVDVRSDTKNCGECGNACPAPKNAGAVCAAGRCTRGPCAPGFFDLDGAATPGCEARCEGTRCTLGDGSTVVLASAPIPESGLVGSALATGSSYGGLVQTGPGHTNIAILGESTPTSPGTVEQRGTGHRHVGGFTATQTR